MNQENRYRWLTIFALLVLPFLCFSQARRSPQRGAVDRSRPPFLQQANSLDSTATTTRLELRNGLTILVEEYRSQPIVSIQTHIRAGSFQEPENGIGVSRLLASIIEKGPTGASRGDLWQDVRALGGIQNWAVDYDDTKYEIVVPSSQWKKALELQTEAILNASLDSGNLTAEAHHLIGEARSALENPSEYAKEVLLELAFNQPRFAKYGEIMRSDLQSVKLPGLIDFYKTMYVAPRITLVISGDVSSSEVFNEIVRLYGKFTVPATKVTKATKAPLRESQNEFRYRLVRGNIAVPQILFGFHAVPENAEDFRALEVLSAILGLGEGSTFNVRLRDQMGLIFNEETNLLAKSGFGYLLIRMEMDPANIDRCEIAVLSEIELLKRKDLDKAEVSRAQAQLELEHWKHRETASNRAETLAYSEALGNWKRANQYITEIKKVEPADIRRVANKYLRMERCSLVEYQPASDTSRNTTVEGMRQTLEGLLESSTDQENAKREKEVIPYMKIPEITEAFNFSEVRHSFQVASILRGPDMLIREDHTSPLIEMGFFFRGGKSAETKKNAGITHLMMQLILRGTKEVPAPQFQRQLELYGARVQPVVQDDYFGVMFSVLSGNFSPGFELLQQAFKTPVFDKDGIDRQKEIQKQQMLVRKNSDLFAQDLLNQSLFRDFSYSSNSLGSEAGISEIAEASILEWHSEYVKNRKPYVAIIGDTKGSSLSPHFVKHFSGSRIQEVKTPEEWPKPLEKPAIIEQSWDRLTSRILVGFQAAPIDDEDSSTMRVLEALMENRARLSRTDGDDLHAGKGSTIDYIPRLRGGSFIAGSVADHKDEEKALNALKGEIQKVVAGPNTYRNIRSAINAAVGEYQIQNQSRSEQIRQILIYLIAGRGIEGFVNLPSELQMIKEEDLAEVGHKTLDMQKAVIVQIHGRPK
jgi:zinc protease